MGDLVAGITVGLTVIPQALAYSGIAGLPAAVSFHKIMVVLVSYILYIFFLSTVWSLWFLPWLHRVHIPR